MFNARPIILIWITVGISALNLLSGLDLIHFISHRVLSWVLMGVFFTSLVYVWRVFHQISAAIHHSVKTWDGDLKKDISNFLKTKKTMFVTSASFLTLLFLGTLFTSFLKDQKHTHEIVSYIYMIVLFHVSLVATFIFSKMYRTLSWASYENKLEKMETR